MHCLPELKSIYKHALNSGAQCILTQSILPPLRYISMFQKLECLQLLLVLPHSPIWRTDSDAKAVFKAPKTCCASSFQINVFLSNGQSQRCNEIYKIMYIFSIVIDKAKQMVLAGHVIARCRWSPQYKYNSLCTFEPFLFQSVEGELL